MHRTAIAVLAAAAISVPICASAVPDQAGKNRTLTAMLLRNMIRRSR